MTAFPRRAGIKALAATPLITAATQRPAMAAPLRALAMNSLTSTLGVCMVTSTTVGPWGQRPQILQALSDLGATWYRTNLYTGNKRQISWLQELGANGHQLHALMGNPSQMTGTPEPLVALVAASLTGVTQSFEGPNEWDLRGGADWVPELRTYQTRLYQAAKATAATRNIPVAAPAFGTPWKSTSYDAFGYAGNICDWGNSHIYTGGFVPGYRTDLMLDLERRVSGPIPQMVSETGWHNAPNTTTSHFYTPEAVAGVYAPRLLLEYVARGVPKMSLYELINDRADPGGTDREANFGLLRYDLSRKPAFHSMANLNAVINQQFRTGGRGQPAPLFADIQVEAGRLDELATVLVARPDGRYLLFVWRPLAAIYDPRKRLYLNPGTMPMSVDWTAPKRVRRFVPNQSASALEVRTESRTELTLGAELQVLIVEPA
ncbi:MAG: hypothetical protein V9G19_27310 [Tetrasphaera sp.]